MRGFVCNLEEQGQSRGACLVTAGEDSAPACQVTLKREGDKIFRLVKSVHLSRPENYLSIYQSGCNLSCRKCHSWEFSQYKNGTWLSLAEIAQECKRYEAEVTLWEPRERATAWHAGDSCRCCGTCVLYGRKSKDCPGVVERSQVVLGPQGFGPARNIVAFTGGDVMCQPDFYCDCTQAIKRDTKLWVLLETNGYGLTSQNLDSYASAGVDAFWLDIKAFDDDVHRWLTGVSNKDILRLPGEILKRGFVLEVLSLYIPTVVETDQLVKIARLLAEVEPAIPFTVLAFFPENKMLDYRAPNVKEMIEAYDRVCEVGLRNVRLGNYGVFAKTESDVIALRNTLGKSF